MRIYGTKLMKNCTQCKQTKPLSDYYKNGTRKGRRSECKKCGIASRRANMKNMIDGYWRVYKLPSENYVGITSCMKSRMNSHRSGKQTPAKNVDDVKVLAKYKKVEWAIIHEAIYHLLGYNGCHLKPNTFGRVNITQQEIDKQLYERTDVN